MKYPFYFQSSYYQSFSSCLGIVLDYHKTEINGGGHGSSSEAPTLYWVGHVNYSKRATWGISLVETQYDLPISSVQVCKSQYKHE